MKGDRWLIVAAVLVAALVVWAMISERDKCTARGGQYARGLIWFECITKGK